MNINRPLTVERLKQIERKLSYWDCACTDDNDADPCMRCQFQELADAETYWREAAGKTSETPEQVNK